MVPNRLLYHRFEVWLGRLNKVLLDAGEPPWWPSERFRPTLGWGLLHIKPIVRINEGLCEPTTWDSVNIFWHLLTGVVDARCRIYTCKAVLSSAIILFMQAEELRKALWAKDVPAKVYVGMRYWHPFTEEAIEQVHCTILVCTLVIFV